MNGFVILIGIIMICFASILSRSLNKGQKIKKISFKIKNIVSLDAEMQKEKETTDAEDIDCLKKQ